MTFHLSQPSLSGIRANLIIEKLADFPLNVDRINIFATGRTGSGKTTLGNRLIGIDYFMPSSGYQDCTDEVNLIKFPMGLNYFDLPGVCSDDRLENYNRVALNTTRISVNSSLTCPPAHLPTCDNRTDILLTEQYWGCSWLRTSGRFSLS